jgi:cob(I)alamin adenosyltransferase
MQARRREGASAVTIYTRTGDEGQTSLGDGRRVPKSSGRVEAYGTVDEASSLVGLARAALTDERLDDVLRFLQQRLFNCASSLAFPNVPEQDSARHLRQADIDALERAIDAFADASGSLDHFIVPAGSDTVARLHVARTVVRRAERRVDALAQESEIDPLVLSFLNRSSDLLFAAARYAATLDGVSEETWDPTAKPPEL